MQVPPPLDSNAAARAAEVLMQFGNIEVPTKRGPQQLAEMIIRRGFAALQVLCSHHHTVAGQNHNLV